MLTVIRALALLAILALVGVCLLWGLAALARDVLS